MIAGVIEGFYGPPWSRGERLELFGWMVEWQLNTYLYAPKDDLKHRAIWRETYSPQEEAAIAELVRECRKKGIEFVYGIGPGLDIRYADTDDLGALERRVLQLQAQGCRSFALLFDDIPDAMRAEDRKRFGSFAAAQCFVANTLVKLIDGRFFFCPTPYCGRMSERRLGGEGYLETIGRELNPRIEIFWTGPEIISEEITKEHVDMIAGKLKRPPVIWDNLHANDYDGRRFYCGPFQKRTREANGILINANNELPLNFMAVRTFGKFLKSASWDSRQEYLEAMREWFGRFETVGASLDFDDFILFGDCFYLPYEDGETARRIFEFEPTVLERLKNFCAQLAGLKDRALFAALHRRVWELREELDLLEKAARNPGAATFSDFHLPKTYRGGVVARLQELLKRNADGSFERA